MRSFINKHQTLLVFMLFCLVYACLLNDRPLNNPDESRYSEIAYEMLQTGDFITPRYNGVLFLDKPPLYYWLQASAIKIFGLHNGSLRFFPAVFALFGALTVYHTCKRLFNRDTAQLSASILLSSPLYFFIALYANLDMEVAVLISNALLFFAMAEFVSMSTNKRNLYLYAAYLCAGLAILTKGLIGIVLPALSIGIWLILTGQLRKILQYKIPSGVGLILLINAPWYYLADQANPGFLHFFFYEQQFTRFVGSQFNAHNPFYFYLGLLLAGTFPWSVFSLQALYKALQQTKSAYCLHGSLPLPISHKFELKTHSPLVILYFVCWLVSITTFFSLPASKLASYIIPAMPPLAILIGHYLTHDALRNRILPQALWSMFVISSLLLILLGWAWLHYPMPSKGIQLSFLTVSLMVLFGLICCLIKGRRTIYQLYLGSALSLCTLLTLSVPHWIEFMANNSPTTASTQKLAAIINAKPTLPIYAYKSYYYDLPLLLKHPIPIVEEWQQHDLEKIDSWIGKFAWGQKQEGKKNPILVLPNEFWQQWHNKENKILVITRNENLKDFKHYILIKSHKRNSLITNR